MARKRSAVDGVLLVDKPRGMTSHDVVACVRRLLQTREVGHAGTLDPMATGLLVLGIGEGTKLLQFLTAHAKSYAATVKFGVTTETLDADGTTSSTAPLSAELALELARGDGPLLETARQTELTRERQVPPLYSAIHVDGKRAHELARAGVEVELAERPVAVHDIAFARGNDDTSLDVRVTAAKGYYVRSLARDLGANLGTVAHLTALRRLASGAFVMGNVACLHLEGATTESATAATLPLAHAAAMALPTARLDPEGVLAAQRGQRVHVEAPLGTPCAWLDDCGDLVAIGENSAEGGRVLRGFRPVQKDA